MLLRPILLSIYAYWASTMCCSLVSSRPKKQQSGTPGGVSRDLRLRDVEKYSRSFSWGVGSKIENTGYHFLIIKL